MANAPKFAAGRVITRAEACDGQTRFLSDAIYDALQSRGFVILHRTARFTESSVPMIALTPELINALHLLDDAVAGQHHTENLYAARRIVMTMIAEARAERAS